MTFLPDGDTEAALALIGTAMAGGDWRRSLPQYEHSVPLVFVRDELAQSWLDSSSASDQRFSPDRSTSVP